jgi:hypothetical protein
MKRRIVLPLLFTVFMLCFAQIALPAQGAGKSHAGFSVQQDATEEADPCSVEHEVPGTVLSDIFLLDSPDRSGLPLIKLIKTDIIEVLGKNNTGFWIAARSNSGIIGWVDSTQVLVDKKLWGNPKIVPVVDELPEDESVDDADESGDEDEADTEDEGDTDDDEGDDEGDEGDDAGDEGDEGDDADPFAGCTTLEAVVTADRFALQVKPLTRSGDAGETVTRNQKVLMIALNPSGSWALIQTENGVLGWITTSYTRPTLGVARMARLPKDFTVSEATLTPVP